MSHFLALVMAVEYDKVIGSVVGVVGGILAILTFLVTIKCCVKWKLDVRIEYIPPTVHDRSLRVRLVSRGSPARLRAVKINGQALPANGALWPVDRMQALKNKWRERGITCQWNSLSVDQPLQRADPLLTCTRGNANDQDWVQFKVETQALLAEVLGKLEIWYDPSPGGGVWYCLTCGDRKITKRCVLYSYHDFRIYAYRHGEVEGGQGSEHHGVVVCPADLWTLQ